MSKTERVNTLVIGGGQAGLVTGYHLGQRGVNFAILDGAPRVGDSWRRRWDSLRLFTWAYMNELPGMPFPGGVKMHLPSKDELADYLEQYAAKFSLPVRLGFQVKHLTRDGDRYVVSSASGDRFEADNVVVATGPFQKPRIPGFAAELDPSIAQLHSSAYRNPGQLRDGDTLVVGAATSGSDIAMELAASRRVYLSGPSVEVFPRSKQKVLRRLIPWVYSRPRTSFIGKKLFAKVRGGGHPLIGYTYKEVTRTGVVRMPRVSGVREGRPVLEDGKVLDVANVLWATGYDIDFSWIDLPVFESDGYPRHLRGVVEEEPGLYFVGLIFLHSLSSQLLMGVGRDTRHVTDELVRRSTATQAAPALSPGYQAGGSRA
jgi:putative flavoprotein involved in K+ transport